MLSFCSCATLEVPVASLAAPGVAGGPNATGYSATRTAVPLTDTISMLVVLFSERRSIVS
jgi:hypothetical protein